jgi:hypothetical protein
MQVRYIVTLSPASIPLYLGISRADSTTFNAWLTEETVLLSAGAFGSTGTFDGRIATAKSFATDFITDFRSKHIRIRLLAQQTSGAVSINLSNITIETGRTLGGVIV